MPTTPNRRAERRGVSPNGAPVGYGQQRGSSPYLDQPEDPQDERSTRPQMAFERGAPAAPEPAFRQALNGPPQGGVPTMPQQQWQGQVPPQHAQGYQRAHAAMQEDGMNPQAQAGALAGLSALGGFGPTAAGQTDADYGATMTSARTPQPEGKQPFQTALMRSGGMYDGPADKLTPDQLAAFQTAIGAPQLQSQSAPNAGLADAVRRAAANNYVDIEGAQNILGGDFMHQLEGFGNLDPNGERGSNTQKKLFGRIASRYDVTQPDAVRRLMGDPDFQAAFPGAKLVEHPNADLIDFGDGNPVDVIRAAVAGGAGEGWQWGVKTPGAPAAGGGAMPPTGGGGFDPSAQMMAALQGGGFQQGIDINQIIAMLGMQEQSRPFFADQQQQLI